VGPVTVGIGYAADRVRETVGHAAEFVLNPRFAATNSLHTFFLTRERLSGPVVILNSDVLFDPQVLEAVLEAGEDSVAYDSLSDWTREHMKVAARGGRVVSLSKELSEAETAGENVGMLYLSARSLEVVFAEAEKLVGAGRTDAFLAEAVRGSIGRIELKAVDVAGMAWTEIDTPHDLERARREVWPRIGARRGVRSGVWRRRRRWRRAGAALVVAAALGLAFAGGWRLAPRGAAPGWETVALSGAREVAVMVGGVAQPWWRGGAEPIGLELEGPRTVRIEHRGLVAAGARDGVAYVVEVRLDGSRPDAHRFAAVIDAGAAVPDLAVCERQWMDVAVPAGRHALTVVLLSGELQSLLVRFRVMGTGEK
jgi:choline kinase